MLRVLKGLSRMKCYTRIHVQCLAMVFGYVMHNNPNVGLKYSAGAPNTGKLVAYSDAIFNDDQGTARSTNAVAVMLNKLC
jgi:hypothetical protein